MRGSSRLIYGLRMGIRLSREIDPKYLDAEKPEDRQVWEKQK